MKLRRKHSTMLLANKMKRVAKKHSAWREFRAWVDPMASSVLAGLRRIAARAHTWRESCAR
jgi:hypothetical protein